MSGTTVKAIAAATVLVACAAAPARADAVRQILDTPAPVVARLKEAFGE